jgi:hypothetical protein
MRRIVTVSILLLFLIGCRPKGGKGGLVQGKLTYKGQPVNNAALILIATGGKGESVSIPVSQEGTFSSADIPPGEYKIVVEGSSGAGVDTSRMDPAKLAQAKEKIERMKGKPTIPYPDKYKSHLTTDLVRTIVKGEQTLDLELKD